MSITPLQPDQRSTEKQALRKMLRERRRGISQDHRQLAALGVARLAENLPTWNAAYRLGCYLATPEELDCDPLITAAWGAGKQTFLPTMGSGKQLLFRRYCTGDVLRERRYGIRQPIETASPVNVEALDILFLPLVGWNVGGERLGMGGGYYDRTLEKARPGLLVGLGYDCQEYDELAPEQWDVPVDYILTGSRLVTCSG